LQYISLLLGKINVILVANLILTFPMIKFDVICLLADDVKSRNVEEHPTDIVTIYVGLPHALPI
jgi:hypothetical protein